MECVLYGYMYSDFRSSTSIVEALELVLEFALELALALALAIVLAILYDKNSRNTDFNN